MITLYADENTLLVEAMDITNNKTGLPVANPTVTVDVTYKGVALTGQSWPLVLEEDSDGTFSGLISADTDIVAGRPYLVVLTVEADGNTAQLKRTIFAKTRDFPDSIV